MYLKPIIANILRRRCAKLPRNPHKIRELHVLLSISPADWTIIIYGILALMLGTIGLAKPDVQFRMMGIEPAQRREAGDLTLASFGASSLAAINMGVLYILGTILHWRGFSRSAAKVAGGMR